jgi:tetratricopeptide (TPR) repeat protein
MELGRTKEAERTLLDLLELDRNNGNAHMMLSRIYARDGREEDSWLSMRKAFLGADVSIDEKIGVLLRFFSASELDSEARERAFILLDRLDQVHPDDPKTHSMYGDYLLREGDYEGARQRFARAVAIDPSHPLIWAQLTELDVQLRDWEALISHAEEARSLFPAQPVFYLMLGVGQVQLKQLDEAIRNFNVGKSYVVDDDLLLANFWSNLGDCYQEVREYKRSEEAFEKALKLNPDDAFVMNNYAYYLSLRGKKLERAAELSARSNELMPNTPSFQDTYGWVLFRQARYAEALEWVGKALDGGALDGVVLEHYGDILFHLDRRTEAIEYWEAAASAGGASDLINQKIDAGTYIDDLKP